MNWKIIPVTILIVFFIQGCGGFKPMEMSAVLSKEQQKGYEDTIRSQKKHFVSLTPSPIYKPSRIGTYFVIFVKNCGNNPIDISTYNISAEFDGNTGKWASRNIAVLSLDEIKNRLKMIQIKSQVDINLSTRTEYIRTYDLEGNYTGTRAYTVSDAPGYQRARSFYSSTSEEIEAMEELVLQPQTLQPGEGGGGLVVCDTKGMDSKVEGEFNIVVSVDGEQHEFTFNRSFADRRQDHHEQNN